LIFLSKAQAEKLKKHKETQKNKKTRHFIKTQKIQKRRTKAC